MTSKLHTPGILFGALLAALTTLPAAHAVAPVDPPGVYREGEVLVRYRAGVSGNEVQALHGKLGLLGKRSVAVARPGDTELLALPAMTTTAAALAVLRADPAVELAEPNYHRFPRAFVPNDPLFAEQWGLRNTGQANFVGGGPAGIADADLNMVQAWDGNNDAAADRIGDPAVIVAVIDDAIQTTHPDLAANLLPGHNFIDCQDAGNVTPLTPEGQHGTLVSGCIVGDGNNVNGVAGVAWGASLLPLKFGFDTASHLEALAYARDNGAKIINASFGGPGFSQMERDLIASLANDDVLYVTSAGNDDSNTDLAQLNYPANYDADNIISVAATNRQDDIASFSQYGPLTTDVAAPGLQIVTTAIGSSYSTSGVSGTSFSSPYIAGVAALLKSHVLPTPGYLEMKARLIESGSAVTGANPKQRTAGGRVDADKALDMDPGPALVLTGLAFDDGDNDTLDPGETLTATFSVRNLWQGATNVMATLAVDDPGITVDTASPVAMGSIAALTDDSVDFQITVAGGITEHRYVNFTLTLAADGGYTATRTVGAEIGTLAANTVVTQDFLDDVYDEFHAWHFGVPPGVGTRTLIIRTTTTNDRDIDLLVKHGVPPRYSITVGINPETTAGFFCTSGTTSNCQDPNTLLSAGLNGVESVSVVNPTGTYHAVVVNFVQEAAPYTIEAAMFAGDLRPDAFDFVVVSGAPPNTTVQSNEELITGIDAPSPIAISGGEYSIDGGAFTSVAATINNNQRVRVRTNSSGPGGSGRAQLNIGGVQEIFFVNPQTSPGFSGGGEQSCSSNRGGDGGRLPASMLAGLLLAALARRSLRRA